MPVQHTFQCINAEIIIHDHRDFPGHHIPVVPSEEIYNINPDYIVLLPWRYAEPIMKKHQKYLKNGGHFIIPLPGVEII